MLNRRTLLMALGTAAVRPPYSFAQQNSGKLRRIGWLVPGRQTEQESILEEYRRGMRELGYVEGRTVETEYLYADGRLDRLSGLAAKLVRDKVDVIITVSTPASLAAKRATDKIPIVFAASADPISSGVVTSLAYPGGNVTGLSLMASDLSAKRLELNSYRGSAGEPDRGSMGLAGASGLAIPIEASQATSSHAPTNAHAMAIAIIASRINIRRLRALRLAERSALEINSLTLAAALRSAARSRS